MNEEHALEALMTELDKELNTCEVSLRTGAPANFTDYKYVCGQIRGLETAQSCIQRLLQNLRENDDE